MTMPLKAGRYALDLARPRVMAIVNVTPDSFSDGSAAMTPTRAIAKCEAALAAGADILDIGGESTRPGSAPVSADDEIARVAPVLKAAVTMGVPVSIDTHKPAVMRAALDLGVDFVNDIFGLLAPGALEVVAAHGTCGVCLMHMRGTPQTMAGFTAYGDVVAEVRGELAVRIAAAEAAGIARDRLLADPGIGFAKTPAQNLALLERQRDLLTLGVPLLVGWSRKSTLARLLGVAAKPPEERTDDERRVLDDASIACAVVAVERGARIVRVHDVAGTVRALRVWQAVSVSAGASAEQLETRRPTDNSRHP